MRERARARSLQLCLLVALLLCAAPARAQDAEPPARKPPAAARGFQMSLQLGWAFPLGQASAAPGDDLAARYSSQFAPTLELGGKPIPRLYLGAYRGFSVGFEGNDKRVERQCDDQDTNAQNDISCGSASLRAGIQAQYHFRPDAFWNPWAGYGIGVISGFQSISDEPRRRTERTSSVGVQFARLSAGVDYRAHRVFGVGPMVEAAFGTFTRTSTTVNDRTVYAGPVPDRAVHCWLTFSLRMVFFP